MKSDLVTSIATTIVGAAVAFFICNFFLPTPEDVSIKTLSGGSSNYTLSEPDVNVFNYRALNPTVEVYVGDCAQYDENGQCLEDNPEDLTEDEIIDIEDETEEEETEQKDQENSENTENKTEDNTNGSTD